MVTWFHYFWVCGEAEYHGGKGKVSHFVAERERGKGQGQNIPFKDTFPETWFL
jgi:hypothetical protein